MLNDYYRVPGVDNWTIIELQGTLETKEDVSLEGKAIGDLHFDGKVGETIVNYGETKERLL